MVDGDFEFHLPTPLTADAWVTVTGGGLPSRADVRVERVNGQLAIVGLRFEAGEAITSSTLRQVRLGSLLGQLGEFLHREWGRALSIVLLPGLFPEDPEPAEAGATYDVLRDWLGVFEPVQETPSVDLASRGPGAKPPSAAELAWFADKYATNARVRGRGAVTQTAKDLGLSRATAHRWINLCKEQGLLPTEEDS